MARDLTLETQVQQVLDELWFEKLIAFQLKVGKITKSANEYTIHFYDSRIRNAQVPLVKRRSLEESIRSAVLDRVAEISEPFKRSD